MGKKIKFVLWIIIVIAIVALIGFCVYNIVKSKTDKVVYPEVIFEIENHGNIKMELYPEYAPNTVANFIKLVEKGYYNEKVIYGKDEVCLYVGRNQEGEAVNPKISLITDNVEADSENDYDYTIPGEFVANGFKQNTLRHEKGVISLIRNDYTQYVSTLTSESYNSGNAQIGIMMTDTASNLNGVYAAFGKVTEGLEILEKIYKETEIAKEEAPEDATTDATTETTAEEATGETTDESAEETGGIQSFNVYPKIKTATVDTHGIDYGMPITEEAFDYSAYMYDLMNQYSGQ